MQHAGLGSKVSSSDVVVYNTDSLPNEGSFEAEEAVADENTRLLGASCGSEEPSPKKPISVSIALKFAEQH